MRQPLAPSPQARRLTRRQAVHRLAFGGVLASSRPLFGQAPAIVAAPGARPVVTDGVASTANNQ